MGVDDLKRKEGGATLAIGSIPSCDDHRNSLKQTQSRDVYSLGLERVGLETFFGTSRSRLGLEDITLSLIHI